jgi:hypothetical protein
VDETGISHDARRGMKSSISVPTPEHSSQFLLIEEFDYKYVQNSTVFKKPDIKSQSKCL